MAEITKGDLLEVAGDLRDHIDMRINEVRTEQADRFRDINDHLRQLNNKVADHETKILVEAQKTRSLQNTVFNRLRRQIVATPIGASSANEDALPALTKGDMKKIVGAMGLLIVLVEALHKVGGLLLGLLPRAGR